MSNGSELKSPAAKALREAGYVPLPRLWVTHEDLALIKYMALQHEAEVNRIRKTASRTADTATLSKEEQMERAWSMRNSCK